MAAPVSFVAGHRLSASRPYIGAEIYVYFYSSGKGPKGPVILERSDAKKWLFSGILMTLCLLSDLLIASQNDEETDQHVDKRARSVASPARQQVAPPSRVTYAAALPKASNQARQTAPLPKATSPRVTAMPRPCAGP
jgi:hypothetical protein